MADQGSNEFSVSREGPFDETWTNTVRDGSGGTGQSGGVVSGSGFSSGGGGVSGSGALTVINVGGVVVNFSAESIDLSNVDVVARRLGEAVKRGTTDAIQLAQAVYTAGEKIQGWRGEYTQILKPGLNPGC